MVSFAAARYCFDGFYVYELKRQHQARLNSCTHTVLPLFALPPPRHRRMLTMMSHMTQGPATAPCQSTGTRVSAWQQPPTAEAAAVLLPRQRSRGQTATVCPRCCRHRRSNSTMQQHIIRHCLLLFCHLAVSLLAQVRHLLCTLHPLPALLLQLQQQQQQ